MSTRCHTGLRNDECFSKYTKDMHSIRPYWPACAVSMSGDEQQSLKVLAATDPKECQRLGRQAKPNPNFDWASHERAVMTRGCMAKFTQNKASRYALLRTADTSLGESSRSRHWGTGMYIDHPEAFNTRAWENNLLGQVLSSVRDTIRSTMGTT